jgi:hypothetical protein
MYQWTDVYEDTYLKEHIEEVMKAQKNLADNGQVLCSTYEQLWLPVMGSLPDVEYVGQDRYRAPYGNFQPIPSQPFHGALAFTSKPGADLPPELCNPREWLLAVASIDLDGRMLKIEAGDTAITFAGVNVNLKPHELLRDINRELVRTDSGVYVWKIEPILDAPGTIRHLYPEGNVPTLSNAHTRADVTGYALLADRSHLHTLVYAGLAAHKTSVESLWASLIRGKAGASMRGVSLVADGDIKLLSTPLPEFGVIHAGILVRKALPGKWEAADDYAYALVFESGVNVEVELQKLAVKRLQETLAFPIPDDWAKTIWDYALDAGYIERLDTGGDCRGGVRLDLTKDWQALVQGLLEQNLLIV